MLKPRYSTLSESIGDFNRMLDGMNKTQPLERSSLEDIEEMTRDEQELARMEQQIEHAHRVSEGPGMQISQTEANNLASMHSHAADMYGAAATKAAAKVRSYISSQNPAMTSKMQDVTKRLRAKAQEHQTLAKRHNAAGGVVAESKQQGRSSAMQNMRVLAGIEERPFLPRDPGVLGTTRFNEGYEAMARPFGEAKGESAAHDKKMKADAKALKKDADSIKKAADDVDKAHDEDR